MALSTKETHIERMRKKYQETPLVAPRDVRIILGITKGTINRLVNDGTLTAHRLNGHNIKQSRRRFELENVLACLQKIVVK